MENEFKKESWDDFLGELEKEIMDPYSDKVLERLEVPRNLYKMSESDGYVYYTGPCGDSVEIWIKVKDEIISEISYIPHGCGITQAAGSMVTELAIGKPIKDAEKISQEDVLKALDGLPSEHKHCALLVSTTLKKAIENYYSNLKERNL